MAQSTMTAKGGTHRQLIMTMTSPLPTLTQSVDGVEAEADGDEGGGVVERGLHRVHVCAGEGRGVVALVVEAVHLASSSS